MDTGDQEKYLDDALKIVKAQAFYMGKAIENNNLRQCLKEAAIMLAELKTNILSPRNYYALFSLIFDELQYLEQYFKEEYRRGRKIKHLYDSVHQAQSIIPRLYLMVTAGRVFIESGEIQVKDIIFELLGAIKGVQNPIRGLFLRYYLLKMVKDKLPERKEDGLEISLQFILQNLEEMNRLWIRLSTGVTGNEKLVREKERNELKVLVGENITRIASLENLDITTYSQEVLPKIISVLLDTKDTLSQQYLVECIIHAFSENFNITCMNSILDTCTKLVASVDVKSLFINLMDKLAKFIGESDSSREAVQEAEKIFGMLKENIDKVIEENQGSIDSLKILELQVAFIRFTLKCCPSDRKLETVIHIMEITYKNLESSDGLLHGDSVKQLVKLLTLPLESSISIFQLPTFPRLMNHLDFQSRTTLALKILENMSLNATKDKDSQNKEELLDSEEKISSLLEFIKPLLEDSKESAEVDEYEFQSQQLAVSRLVFFIHESDPEKIVKMLVILQKVFIKGGNSRMKYTLPSLINVYLNLISSTYMNFDYTNNPERHPETKAPIHFQYVQRVKCSYDNKGDLNKFLGCCFENILDVIRENLYDAFPDASIKLLISVITNINQLSGLSFNEFSKKSVDLILNLLSDNKIEGDAKINNTILLISTVSMVSCFSNEDYEEICKGLNSLALSFIKRSEQCNAMIYISQLFFHEHFPRDAQQCYKALAKATEFAEYAMSTNTQTFLSLYIVLINKYFYYVEKGADFVKPKNINKLIIKVDNCIQSIKNEGQATSALEEVERYYTLTCEAIKRRMETSDNPILKEIVFQ